MQENKLFFGCVADDFTGAADGASFLVKSGISTALYNGCLLYTSEYCKKGIIPEDEFMNAAYEHGRDNARVPVAWDDTANGGFTDGEPWIKVSGQYKTINARNNLEDPDSVFYFYKKLIELRHHEKIMVHGDFRMLCREAVSYTHLDVYKRQQ